jgi:hypothetical protein
VKGREGKKVKPVAVKLKYQLEENSGKSGRHLGLGPSWKRIKES